MSQIQSGVMYFIPSMLLDSGKVIFEYDWHTQMYRLVINDDAAAEIVAMDLRSDASWNETKDHGRSLGTPTQGSDGAP